MVHKAKSRFGFSKDELNVLERMNVELMVDEKGKIEVASIPYGKAKDTGQTEMQFVMNSLGVSRDKASRLIGKYLDLIEAGKIKR